MDDAFWDLYWESRLQFLQGQGKGHAILAASRLIRQAQNMRILELGCGEGQILGSLVEAHQDIPAIHSSIGVDYDPQALTTARRSHPSVQFLEGDFTNAAFLAVLGNFDLILVVNALHHVFSDGYDEGLGEVDVPYAKEQVREAFRIIQSLLNPGGKILLFDGLDASGDTSRPVTIRFLNPDAQVLFYQFAREYRPFRIHYAGLADRDSIQLSIRDFTRYVTKLIFLGKPLWERERQESYQYFSREEFHSMFRGNALSIKDEQMISVDFVRWQDQFEILTPGVDYPVEHVLFTVQKQ